MTQEKYIQIMFEAFQYGMSYGQYVMRKKCDKERYDDIEFFSSEWQEDKKEQFNCFLNLVGDNLPDE